MEASLSVLADGSAGFEPPAPPTVESDHGHRPHHTDDNIDTDNNPHHHRHHHSSSDKQRGGPDINAPRGGRDGFSSAGGGGGSSNDRTPEGRPDTAERKQEGGRNDSHGDIGERRYFQADREPISHHAGEDHPGDYRDSTCDHAVAAARTSHDIESEAATKASGNGRSDRGGTGVLHGVSAAKASGALPVTARPNPNTNSTADQGQSSTGGGRAAFLNDGNTTSDRLPRVGSDDNSRASGRRLNSAGFHDMTSSGGGEGGGRGFSRESSGGGNDAGAALAGQALTSNWHQDERGEQARRHVDQALRQRALRRRNRWAINIYMDGCGVVNGVDTLSISKYLAFSRSFCFC